MVARWMGQRLQSDRGSLSSLQELFAIRKQGSYSKGKRGSPRKEFKGRIRNEGWKSRGREQEKRKGL